MSAALNQLRKNADAFKYWLTQRGAQVMSPTNEWELIRFRDGGVTSVVYFRKTGEVTFTGSSHAAWDAFKSGAHWRSATPKAKRSGSKKRRARYVETIRQRDGDLCFFCAEHVSEEDESVEHLVEVTAGGPDVLANMFLAHTVCNNNARNLSAAEKIALYHKARVGKQVDTSMLAETPDIPPWEDFPPTSPT